MAKKDAQQDPIEVAAGTAPAVAPEVVAPAAPVAAALRPPPKQWLIKEDLRIVSQGQMTSMKKGKILSAATHGNKLIDDLLKSCKHLIEEVKAEL